MKKIIFILFILLCGISAVSAQTVQRTVKKPNFFMPQNAMQSQTAQNRASQVQKANTVTRTVEQTAKTQPAAKLIKPSRTNNPKAVLSASATNKNAPQRAVKTPASVINKPKQSLPLPEELVQAPKETETVNVVPVQNPQPEPAVDNNDPFQIVFTDYFKDTTAISEGKPYKNPRLDSVIASFVDQDHTLD